MKGLDLVSAANAEHTNMSRSRSRASGMQRSLWTAIVSERVPKASYHLQVFQHHVLHATHVTPTPRFALASLLMQVPPSATSSRHGRSNSPRWLRALAARHCTHETKSLRSIKPSLAPPLALRRISARPVRTAQAELRLAFVYLFLPETTVQCRLRLGAIFYEQC